MNQKKEVRLLLNFLSIGTAETKSGEFRYLLNSDWNDVIQQADKQGVAPLLYQRLQTLSQSITIPAEATQRLQEIYFNIAEWNKQLYHELSKVLRILQNDGIPVIVLKGAALAEVVYSNIALRPMSDVDLLVKKNSLSRVEEKLLAMDYTPDGGNAPFAKNHCHFVYHMLQNESLRVRVEIHWNIAPPSSLFQIDIDGMWERARPAKIANVEVLVLSPEDLILHLCLHASFHHKFRSGIKHICDIPETIQHYKDKIDYKQLISTANEYGISKFIYCTLSLTKKMLGTEIPDDVLNELKPDTFDPQLINLAEEMILSNISSQVAPSVVDAFSPEKLIDKLKVTLKHLFPSRSSVATRFPVSENSIFLYPFYLAYPFNFILRRWQFLWRLTKRDKAILSEFKQAVAQKRRAEILERWLSS